MLLVIRVYNEMMKLNGFQFLTDKDAGCMASELRVLN